MILNALCEYYDILSSNSSVEIAKSGYSIAKISYAIVLDDNGTILSFMDLRETSGKKLVPKILLLPKVKDKTMDVKTSAFPLWDNAQFVFGYSKKEVKEDNKKVKKLVVNSAAFQAFKDYNLKLLENINNSDADSLRNFLNNWNPQNAETVLSDISGFDESILEACNFIFMNKDFKYIHENTDIKNAWEEFKQDHDAEKGQCLITGKNSAIARLHPKIKGVRDAQSAGANIVSFNADAFTSYGKEQSFNAPVSENAAFKYGTVLNYMLQSDKQKMFMGGSTVVFWAEHASPKYNEIFNAFLSPSAKAEDNKTDDEKTHDEKQERLIKGVLSAVKSGSKLSIEEEELSKDTNFCILALAPNNARISIRFFYKDTFGDLIKKIGQHYEDMKIVGARLENVPLWLLLKETVPTGSKENASSPLLAGRVFTAILTGGMYPSSLFSTIIERIRADRDVNSTRASIIKAYLIRKHKKEELTVSLNEESKEPAYLLGRLFAVLEQAQWKALGDVNSGIKERFFASAAASPRRIFPQLLKNTQNHLAKMDNSIWLDKKIGEIMAGIDSFPVQFNLDEQGMFMLGYYHQRQALFTKTEKTEDKE
jgi:CRISPR-associated protein Csd1